jgi:hypothetical protein
MFRRSTTEKNEKDVAGHYVTGADLEAASISSYGTGIAPKANGDGEFTPMDAVAEESFDHDAFTAQHADEEDYVDFRSMGWLKAGLIATAEVSFSAQQ